MAPERPNSILRIGSLAFALFIITYGGLFIVSLLSSDNVQGLAKTAQMLGFGMIPALLAWVFLTVFVSRSHRLWSALRLWLVYSPFLILSLCTGFLFAVRLGSPYSAPRVFENKARCYAVSIPSNAAVDASNPDHAQFNTPEWSGAVQFIPGERDPVAYLEKFQSQMKKENPSVQFEKNIEGVDLDGMAVRIRARSVLNNEGVHISSVFAKGKKDDLIHVYSMLPEAPIRDAEEFSNHWAESFVWTGGCSY